MGNPHMSQSEMMENYMKFCMQQQNQSKSENNMYEQFINNTQQTQQQTQHPSMNNKIHPPMAGVYNDHQTQQNPNMHMRMHNDYTNAPHPPPQSQMFMSQMNNNNKFEQKQDTNEIPLFEQFMKQQINKQIPHSFIPFDIDNFNGDGLQKAFDLAYQNESKKINENIL